MLANQAFDSVVFLHAFSPDEKSPLKTILFVWIVVFVFAALVLRLMLFAGRVHVNH